MGQPIDNDIFCFLGPIFIFVGCFPGLSVRRSNCVYQFLLSQDSFLFFPDYFSPLQMISCCYISLFLCILRVSQDVSSFLVPSCTSNMCASRMVWFPGWQALSWSVFQQTSSSVLCFSPSNWVIFVAAPIGVPTAYEIRQPGLGF